MEGRKLTDENLRQKIYLEKKRRNQRHRELHSFYRVQQYLEKDMPPRPCNFVSSGLSDLYTFCELVREYNLYTAEDQLGPLEVLVRKNGVTADSFAKYAGVTREKLADFLGYTPEQMQKLWG